VSALQTGHTGRETMRGLAWWMRAVGGLYLFVFVAAALLRLPIRDEGPAGVLERASAGDPLARFVVDTWVTLGLEVGAVGVALLIASRQAGRARALVGAVLSMETAGIVADIYKIVRGYSSPAPFVWMIIHTLVIATGWRLLARSREAAQPATMPAAGTLRSPSA
jgi:hypothetical protein